MNFIVSQDSLVEGFIKSAPESNFIFCEGKSDVAIINLVQNIILNEKLFNSKVRKFLETTKIMNIFTDDGLNQGAGQLSHQLKSGFPDALLKKYNKKIFGVFDGDQKGLQGASAVLLTIDKRPDLGKRVTVTQNYKYYYNLQSPKEIKRSKFKGEFGPTIEHFLYNNRTDLQLNFDPISYKFNGKTKKKLATRNKLKAFLSKQDKKGKEKTLKEFLFLFNELLKK